MAECPEERIDLTSNGTTMENGESYSLHRAVFEGDIEETRRLLTTDGVNQVDMHG